MKFISENKMAGEDICREDGINVEAKLRVNNKLHDYIVTDV